MDGELLNYLYHRLLHSDSGRVGRRGSYSDGAVVLVYFYAALCDRSPRWASKLAHWPPWLRPAMRRLMPGYSQLMRRLKTLAARELVELVGAECRARLPRSTEKVCDGKALVVGGFSKDPDVKGGHVPGGWAKGYRLHLIADGTSGASGAVECFEVTAMDQGEPTVMRRLVARLGAGGGLAGCTLAGCTLAGCTLAGCTLAGCTLAGCTLRGDGNYDSNDLYADVAAFAARLIATRKKPGTGLGHHDHHPDRLRAIGELEGQANVAALEDHRRRRIRVEQNLAHLTNLPFGLAPLPNFVRRLRRVTLWVSAKVALYHLHLTFPLIKNAAA
jgi:hypothetical protein